MKIALCQMANAGKPAANLEKSIRAIKEAAENGADLILFPEVQLTEFFPQYPGQDVTQYRISLDSEVVTAFCRAAQENGILVVPNILLYENGKTYDASLLIQKDGTITIHPPMTGFMYSIRNMGKSGLWFALTDITPKAFARKV